MEELSEHEQQRMIAKLLGSDNLRRFEGAQKVGRRFKYRPPTYHAEYWRMASGGLWTFTIFENGRVRMESSDVDDKGCQNLIRALTAKGVRTRRIYLEAEREEDRARKSRPSERKRILERLRGFQP